ncbi:MAG: hypothetical protein IKV29_03730 [Alistipes sp.]|nr:hypothetical protein [Alistipes sp.]
MKIAKYLLALLLAATMVVACEPIDDTPTTPEDNTEEPKEDEENKGDEENNEELGEIKDVPESTYMLAENLDARVHPLQTNGLRNDYVSFFDVYTDRTLFIDFYAPIECSYLPSGLYPLGDGSVMTSAAEYTYITFKTNGDLNRFVDGWADVRAEKLEDGSVKHTINAHYTLASGETVGLKYEGVLTIKEGL